MGLPSEYPSSSPGQAPACRQRRCLLKGCERPYRPRHPLSRYCSDECRQAARRWSQWRANQRYRAREQGRCRRREQSRRWRTRAAQRQVSDPEELLGEGYQDQAVAEESCCSRPGCYERFTPTARSPLQRFCSCLCRRALRRVRQRESRWRRRRGLAGRPVQRPGNRPDP